jgi:orotidine-5'-phosphate decarboxylase
MRNCADRLLDLIDELGNPSCGGLDPNIDNFPDFIIKEALKKFGLKPREKDQNIETEFEATAWAIEQFNKRIIDSTADVLPAYKPQSAYYEQYKASGMKALENTIRYIQSKGRIAITDAKRNDIQDTAQAYANAHLGIVPLITGVHAPAFYVDMLTVNPYLGSDCIRPFIDVCKIYGKGIFLLAKTSNPSSQELQDLELAEKHGGRNVYEQVALKAEILGRELIGNRGYSSVGMVVGASGETPEKIREQAKIIRRLNAYGIILVPGYGSQGGFGIDTVANFNGDGYGAIVNNARKFIYAYMFEPYKSKYRPEEFDKAAKQAAIDMRDDIVGALKEVGFKRWLK